MKIKQLLITILLVVGGGLVYLPTAADAYEPGARIIGKPSRNKLTLNGSAIRTIFGFKVYHVGLYVTKPTKNEKEIFVDRDKKRIQIKMLREVAGEKFESTVRKNIDNNYSATERKKYTEENERFLGCFSKRVLPENSIVDIDFIPGKGTEVLIDRKRIDLIPGDDYYHVLLRLWIGTPLQTSIKEGLLGNVEG